MKRQIGLSSGLILQAALASMCVRAADTDAVSGPPPSAYLYTASSVSAANAADDDFASRGPLKLTLRRAVQMATSPEGSVRVQIQNENVKQARMRSNEVRAGFSAGYRVLRQHSIHRAQLIGPGLDRHQTQRSGICSGASRRPGTAFQYVGWEHPNPQPLRPIPRS